jgi:hypothetical protein
MRVDSPVRTVSVQRCFGTAINVTRLSSTLDSLIKLRKDIVNVYYGDEG